jgi:hypothetical protein
VGGSVLVLAVLTLPFIEQGRWPFASWLQPTIIHDDPIAEEVATATAPIQRQLDDVKKQRDAALSDSANLRTQLQRAQRDLLDTAHHGKGAEPKNQDVVQLPLSRTIESLSADERDLLSRDLYRLKGELPVIIVTVSGVNPPSHNRSEFVDIFRKAGIQPGTSDQSVEGPDQGGLLLCVPDVNDIPDKVKKLADVLRKYGIETSYAPLVLSRIGGVVPPDVGFVLFIGPKLS